MNIQENSFAQMCAYFEANPEEAARLDAQYEARGPQNYADTSDKQRQAQVTLAGRVAERANEIDIHTLLEP